MKPHRPLHFLAATVFLLPPSLFAAEMELPASIAEPGVIRSDDRPIGWASLAGFGPGGTTGGAGGRTVTVTDGMALKEAMYSTKEPLIIRVSGRMKSPGNFSGRRNKTLIGINNAEIFGGSGLVGCENIIVRNIKFSDGPNDSFGLSGCRGIWLDHLEVCDGSDANLDCVNGTDLVTISWCRFYYTRGHGHMLSGLVGNRQPLEADVGRERVTFHHNWWGAGVKSRAPRVRYGRVHVFNNYYRYEKVAGDSGSNYSVGAGFHAKLLVENNLFENIGQAIKLMNDKGTAEVVSRGNVLVDSGNDFSDRGKSFKPPYDYPLTSAEEARDAIVEFAGVR